jgi:glycosyltransferase involved in cell wall biosynthesis
MAVYRILGRKWWYFGKAIGWYYLQLERSLLRKSDAVVLITDDFCPIMEEWGIDKTRIYVLPNWSPLTEIPIHPKQNPWAKKHGLENVLTMLYAGTLGMKHNPELLTQLALKFRDQSDIRIVVLSEGPGVDWLQQRKEELRLNNLVLMGFQPFEDFPQILASADLLLAILEPEAGIFSVPSKVLSYLCAQRPVLLAVPRENLAARIVETHNAGLVVSPNDPDSFLWAAECLLKDKSLREKMGKNARKYAEKHFAIDVITDRFESIFRFK